MNEQVKGLLERNVIVSTPDLLLILFCVVAAICVNVSGQKKHEFHELVAIEDMLVVT